MSALDVIEQIKALPPGERAKVVGFIHEMESAQATQARIADDQTFADAAKWIFSEHVELMRKLSQ